MTFQFPHLIDTAFVASHLHIGSSLGLFSQPGVRVTALDSTGVSRVFQYDRSLGFFAGHVGLEVAPIPALGIELDASYTAMAGGDAASIFLFGGTTSYAIHPGARLRIFRSEKTGTQIGARVYGLIEGGVRVRPAGVVEEISRQLQAFVDDPRRADCLAAGDFSCAFPPGFDALAAMQIKRREYGAGASASVAQAFSRFFGAQAQVGFEAGAASQSTLTTGDVSSVPIAFSVGIAPSVDLAPAKIPLGAMLEYRFRVTTESYSAKASVTAGSTSSIENAVALGVYYTGRRELGLGIIGHAQFFTTKLTAGALSISEPLTSILTAQVSMRYFF